MGAGRFVGPSGALECSFEAKDGTTELHEVASGGRAEVSQSVTATQQSIEQLGEYVEATGVDGFLLAPFTVPGSYNEFAEQVAPALRDAGLLAEQSPGTFRESLFPDSWPHLPASHPAHAPRTPAPAGP